MVSSELTKQRLSPHLGICNGEPCFCTPAPTLIPQPYLLFLSLREACSPAKATALRAGRQAGDRQAGRPDDDSCSLSVECSLFKGLAGEEAKFKARLPEKITCHVKIVAI